MGVLDWIRLRRAEVSSTLKVPPCLLASLACLVKSYIGGASDRASGGSRPQKAETLVRRALVEALVQRVTFGDPLLFRINCRPPLFHACEISWRLKKIEPPFVHWSPNYAAARRLAGASGISMANHVSRGHNHASSVFNSRFAKNHEISWIKHKISWMIQKITNFKDFFIMLSNFRAAHFNWANNYLQEFVQQRFYRSVNRLCVSLRCVRKYLVPKIAYTHRG